VQAALVTTSGRDEAELIGRELLDRRLVACANVIPQISSLLREMDRWESQNEARRIRKTTPDAPAVLTETVRQRHRYAEVRPGSSGHDT